MDSLILKQKIHKLVDASEDIDLLERIEDYLEDTRQYEIPEHVQKMVVERLNDPEAKNINARESLNDLKNKFNLK